VPEGPENLILKALRLLAEQARVDRCGAAIQLIKRIPPGAGMGGGSSDAAAALLAANIAWKLGWTPERLSRVAASIGSDVPFFLQGRAAICRGRGERIELLEGLTRLHLVVAWPGEVLSTADVYRACRPSERPRPVAPLVAALQSGRLDRVAHRMHNRLQQAAEGLSAAVGRLKQQLARLDCIGYQMTGSGTAWFAICRSAAHARLVAARLRARGVARVDCVASCPRLS
jgi:4-diphosphocytidyl-2-C-methyl-D-erythritol kinase